MLHVEPLINIVLCPVCNSNMQQPFIECKDHTVSYELFKIVECSACGFKFTNPRPSDSNLGTYYKSEDYISHSNTKKGLISKLYHIVRKRTLRKKLKLINSLVSRGTILDYGCGTGMFLKTCANNEWKCEGVEPDNDARKLALDAGLIVNSNRKDIKGTDFDIITLWHVLEHITDLIDTIRFLTELLKNDGKIIIAVPNYTSYDAITYKQFWAGYDVPRHLYHFEINSIKALMKNFGFDLQACLPMKFDSYYVSMLSEKYESGKVNYFKAIINGLISNFKAKSNSDYSSVIYIFRKA